MNICICLLPKSDKNIGNYEKISNKFKTFNSLISTEFVSDTRTLCNQIISSGSKYDKIILPVMGNINNTTSVAEDIRDICKELNGTQSISIITVTGEDCKLTNDLVEDLLTYPDIMKVHEVNKRTPAEFYRAVFGSSKKEVTTQTTNEVNNIIKADMERNNNSPIEPIIIDDDENDNTENVETISIDDSETTRQIEQTILTSAGYSVDTAEDGINGLEKIKAKQYDLVVIDKDMPRMNGLVLLDNLRHMENYAEVPAVVVSADTSPKVEKEFKSLGANAFIAKGSFKRGALISTIQELLHE